MNYKLKKVKTKNKKRVGRGYGSGKGSHTAGRGQKGQRSRSNLGILFEGIKMKKSFIKRLPFKRGKGKLKPKKKPITISLNDLNVFSANRKVNIKSLSEKGLVDKKEAQEKGIKVLGTGEIKKKLTVLVSTSKSAKEKIEKAGGKVSK